MNLRFDILMAPSNGSLGKGDMRLTNHTIFITGGGSGIGLALAEALLARGNKVIVCGREVTKLESAKSENPGLLTMRLDISDEDAARRAVDKLQTEHGGISILINNAAVNGQFFFAGDTEMRTIEDQILINLTATLKLTKLFLPMLLKKPEAAIVNISSALAYVPLARVPIYSATKAALHSASVSLRIQLRNSPVCVFEVFPPSVDTAMTKDSRFFKMPAGEAAGKIIRGMERNRKEIRMGFTHVLYGLHRLAPKLTERVVNSW